jgi:hypothetical protein
MSNVNSALAAGNPFESKAYLTQQNLATSGAMNSANDAEKQALESGVARTGTNTAALANTEASSARQGQRDLTSYNAARDTQNENTWLNQQDKLLGDQQAGANSEASIYGSSLGAQSSDLSSMTQADDAEQQAELALAGDAIGAGGAVGAAFCPAVGTLYLMADGTEKRVEDLNVGEKLMGRDGTPRTIDTIFAVLAPVIQVQTANGFVLLNSYSHEYLRSGGGVVAAWLSIGKPVITAKGDSPVSAITAAGQALVFAVMTDGDNSFQADGVWARGVTAAERPAVIEAWKKFMEPGNNAVAVIQ